MEFDDAFENNNFSLNSTQRRATICNNNVLKPPNSGFKSFVSSRRGSALFRIDKDKKSKISGDVTSIALSESPLMKQVRLSTSFKASSPILYDSLENTSDINHTMTLSDDKKRKIISSLLQVNDILTLKSIPNSPNHQSQSMDIKLQSPDVGSEKLLNNEQIDDNYQGFSIIKNRVSSASKISSIACSPVAGSEEKSKSVQSIVVMHRRRSSSNGAPIMDCSRLIHHTTPHSPQKFHTPLSYPGNTEKYRLEISNLKDILSNKDVEINKLQKLLEETELKRNEIDNNHKMAIEEINSYNFMSSLYDQKVEELEEKLSTERMNQNEIISQKSRKHKNIIKKMNQDRADYETRADSMIQQMNEQMLQLQNMAMGRIETLEKELMSQRHAYEQLQSECSRLRITATNAIASATKHKETIQRLQVTSPILTMKTSNQRGSLGLFHNNNSMNTNRNSNGSSSTATATRTINRNDDDNDDEEEVSDSDTIADENHNMNSPMVLPQEDDDVYPTKQYHKIINIHELSSNIDTSLLDKNVWDHY